MNCEHIKNTVSIRDVLESFNLFPAKANQRTAFYFALDRKGNTPSLCVDFNKNKAFDFGTGKSYDVISIVQQINQCSVSDAIQYLSRFNFSVSNLSKSISHPGNIYEILKKQDIQHQGLIQYLPEKKITFSW